MYSLVALGPKSSSTQPFSLTYNAKAIPALIDVFYDLDKDKNGMLTYEDRW